MAPNPSDTLTVEAANDATAIYARPFPTIGQILADERSFDGPVYQWFRAWFEDGRPTGPEVAFFMNAPAPPQAFVDERTAVGYLEQLNDAARWFGWTERRQTHGASA